MQHNVRNGGILRDKLVTTRSTQTWNEVTVTLFTWLLVVPTAKGTRWGQHEIENRPAEQARRLTDAIEQRPVEKTAHIVFFCHRTN
jgi:hypothetical protein